MTACDPTRLACTPQLALTLAEGLLGATIGRTPSSCDVWASYATAPLAGLLYAAHRDSHGIDWVVVATKNTEHAVTANDVGWAGAAQRVADVPMLAAALTRAAQLETRQRASVALTMLDALAPWSPESDRR